jgi:fructose-1,6-bisphosphatase/sedoheptulose 1,7-bisphosphatase-like protein
MFVFMFFRLKKIQEKKKIIRAKKEKALAELKAQGIDPDDVANLIDDDHDEDLLFTN